MNRNVCFRREIAIREFPLGGIHWSITAIRRRISLAWVGPILWRQDTRPTRLNRSPHKRPKVESLGRFFISEELISRLELLPQSIIGLE